MDRRGAWFQSDFYRDQYRRVLKLFFVLSFFSLLLVCVLGWQLTFNRRPATYFAAVTDGQVLPMKPGVRP